MPRSRRFIAIVSSFGLALAFAGTGLAGGASHAAGSFVNANGDPIGWVRLVEDATGVVHVSVHVEDVTPGLHGIHIHSVGACGPTFAAAGGHYNPFAHEHGLDNPNGPHSGDLPNLVVNGAGIGHLDTTTDRVTISDGPATLFDTTASAVGSAFVIHANPDNQLTNADNGGSGARIACAVIEP